MKHLVLSLLFCLSFSTIMAQMQSGGGDYVFTCVYDSYGDKIEMAGHPQKVNVIVTTTVFFGVLQSSCGYAEYNPMTGMTGGYITMDSYRGERNGWHIYSWNGNFVYIKNDWSKIRVQMSFYNGNYCEYRKMRRNEDINDAATW